MRSVVIFALFALAICQSPVDVLTGFSSQLAFTDSESEDLNTCFMGLVGELQSLTPLYSAYLNGDFELLINDAASYFENLEPAVKNACLPFLADLDDYATTFGNGLELETNIKVNNAYVAQQVGVLILNVAQKNFTGLGSTLGYIFQIAVGSVELPSLTPQPLTYEEAVAIQKNYQAFIANENDAMTQYFQAYVDGLGLTEQVNVTALMQLIGEGQSVAEAIVAFKESTRDGTFDSDIIALEDLVTDILEIVRTNEKGLEAFIAVDAPVYRALLRNPIKFIGRCIFNSLLNAPKLEGFSAEIQQDLIAGDFAAMGAQAADYANTIYGQIYTN